MNIQRVWTSCVTLLGLICSLSVAAGVSAAPAPEAGMFTAVKGEVTVKDAAGVHKARMMGLVCVGDTIQVASGAQAMIVFFGNGRRERLPAGLHATVTATGGKATGKVKPHALAPLSKTLVATLKANAKWDKMTVFKEMRSRDFRANLVPLALGDTAIANLSPVFRWTKITDATIYRLALQDYEGKQIWQTAGSGTSAAYPGDAKPLEWGYRYRWTVRAIANEQTIEECTGTFFILTKNEAAKVTAMARELEHAHLQDDPGDPTSLIALAAVYEEHQLYDDAAGVLERLVTAYPKESNPRYALANVYDNMGRIKDADRLRREAGQL